jgi:hypothetical protein
LLTEAVRWHRVTCTAGCANARPGPLEMPAMTSPMVASEVPAAILMSLTRIRPPSNHESTSRLGAYR